MRRIFIPKREDVTGGWRHFEELPKLYSSLDINTMIKSRRGGGVSVG
jgi:hypothetical protein